MTLFFAKRMAAACLLCTILMWGDYTFPAGFAAGIVAALLKLTLWRGANARLLGALRPAVAGPSGTAGVLEADALPSESEPESPSGRDGTNGATAGVSVPAIRAGLLSTVAPFISLAALAATLAISARAFAGCAAGMMVLPVIIIANTLTEKAGITHNQWH